MKEERLFFFVHAGLHHIRYISYGAQQKQKGMGGSLSLVWYVHISIPVLVGFIP